jgi:hypothetical protein
MCTAQDLSQTPGYTNGALVVCDALFILLTSYEIAGVDRQAKEGIGKFLCFSDV